MKERRFFTVKFTYHV